MDDVQQPTGLRQHGAPSTAGTILFCILIAIDGLAALGAAAGLYDAFSDTYAAGGVLVFAAVLIVVVACIAGAFGLRQRGRRGLGLALALLPAIPTLAAFAFAVLFVATFTHHQ